MAYALVRTLISNNNNNKMNTYIMVSLYKSKNFFINNDKQTTGQRLKVFGWQGNAADALNYIKVG